MRNRFAQHIVVAAMAVATVLTATTVHSGPGRSAVRVSAEESAAGAGHGVFPFPANGLRLDIGPQDTSWGGDYTPDA